MNIKYGRVDCQVKWTAKLYIICKYFWVDSVRENQIIENLYFTFKKYFS